MTGSEHGSGAWLLSLMVGCAAAGPDVPAPALGAPAADAASTATSRTAGGGTATTTPDRTSPEHGGGTGAAADAAGAPEEEPWTSHGRATCAGRKRCPVAEPVCVVDTAGARCVAVGSPGFRAVRGDQRHACTRQGDCEGREGCFFVVGERNWAVNTHCIEHPGPGYQLVAVCDQETDRCDGTDPTCLPCNPLAGDLAKHLPWMGFW